MKPLLYPVPGPGQGLTGVTSASTVTPMKMIKTQVYFDEQDLKALRRVAKRRRRAMADMIRDAVRTVWLQHAARGPVDLWTGPLNGGSVDHDAAFDEP